ncbi:hypothetical protein [Dechloromonas sp. CZR5]|uniref:hypothetical protein n=1 Tax=Dechloromonas sp. CZR5 TaxID=2608630 RepID=UPI00123D28AF|nr:hypothetical protein [Dechloromonas sp. CZR5]
MLSSRAIATLGIGHGAAAVARLGLWPVGIVEQPGGAEPIQPGAFAPLSRASSTISSPFKRRTKKRREEELLLL